jgi:hypothetical protein
MQRAVLWHAVLNYKIPAECNKLNSSILLAKNQQNQSKVYF